MPSLAVQMSPDVVASTGPPSTRCRSVSIAGRSRSTRSMRRTRARCHSDSSPGGTGSDVRTVATRKTRSASTSCATSVADVPSSRWRSSTNRTSGPSLAWSRSTGRTAATTATRSHRSSAIPAGSRCASAPSGVSRAPSVAVARDTLRPCLVGEGEALVGEAGLAHTGRAVDHEPVRARVSERREEQSRARRAGRRAATAAGAWPSREPYRPTQPTVSEKLSNRCSGQRARCRCPLDP